MLIRSVSNECKTQKQKETQDYSTENNYWNTVMRMNIYAEKVTHGELRSNYKYMHISLTDKKNEDLIFYKISTSFIKFNVIYIDYKACTTIIVHYKQFISSLYTV